VRFPPAGGEDLFFAAGFFLGATFADGFSSAAFAVDFTRAAFAAR